MGYLNSELWFNLSLWMLLVALLPLEIQNIHYLFHRTTAVPRVAKCILTLGFLNYQKRKNGMLTWPSVLFRTKFLPLIDLRTKLLPVCCTLSLYIIIN